MEKILWNHKSLDEIAQALAGGKSVILPTDTLYGLVAPVGNQDSFKYLYRIKHRNLSKKLIVLISSPEDLSLFDISITPKQKEILSRLWPGPFSIELSCQSPKYSYLRCGTQSLSFRCPDDNLLRTLLKKTGPLVAPSANPEGLEPAKNITESINYFGDKVSLYVDGGERVSEPSTLLSLLNDKVEAIRGTLPGFLVE